MSSALLSAAMRYAVRNAQCAVRSSALRSMHYAVCSMQYAVLLSAQNTVVLFTDLFQILADTEYVVGEFNCSCVGISKFQAVCGGEKTLADVPDEDYYEACLLTDLMGKKAFEMLTVARASKK